MTDRIDPIIDSRALVAMSRLLAERNAACRELDAARADLREALSLLRNAELRSDLCGWETDNWDERYDALLAKHKETP